MEKILTEPVNLFVFGVIGAWILAWLNLTGKADRKTNLGMLLALLIAVVITALHYYISETFSTRSALYRSAGTLWSHLIVISLAAWVFFLFKRPFSILRAGLLAALPPLFYGQSLILKGDHRTGFLYLGGVLGYVFLISLVSQIFSKKRSAAVREKSFLNFSSKTVIFIFSGLMIVTLLLKFYAYGDAFGGIVIDEAVKGRVALDILEDKVKFRPYFYYREALYFYITAAFLKFFGITIETLRLPATFTAIICTALYFLLARKLFNDETAIASTFFLTFSFWHQNISRVAQRLCLVPLFQLVIILLCDRIFKKGKWYYFILLGLFLGGGFYSYPPYRVMPVFVVLAFLHKFIRNPKWILKKLHWSLLSALIAFIVMAAPLGSDWKHFDDYFISKARLGYRVDPYADDPGEMFKKNLPTLLQTLHRRTAPGGTVRPINTNFPLMDPIVGVFFIIGLGLCLSRIWKQSYFLIMACFLIGFTPGIFAWPFQRRIILSINLSFLIAGIGFAEIFRQIVYAFKKQKKMLPVFVPLILFILCGIGWSNVSILQDRFYHWKGFYNRAAPLRYAAAIHENYEIVLFVSYFDRNSFVYYTHDRIYDKDFHPLQHVDKANSVAEIPFMRDTNERNLAYIVTERKNFTSVEKRISDYYPNAVKETHTFWNNERVLFYVYKVSSENAEEVREKIRSGEMSR